MLPPLQIGGRGLRLAHQRLARQRLARQRLARQRLVRQRLAHHLCDLVEIRSAPDTGTRPQHPPPTPAPDIGTTIRLHTELTG
ncbi:hypothetical protein ACFWDQ_37845 [Streptomyces sp. NPDC060053]|uniref:hypothetical protein n=1 Tax=Streptomyces sp. NPDC060053 TaxID=3347047 RepID=UPI0036CACD96